MIVEINKNEVIVKELESIINSLVKNIEVVFEVVV